jgi:hypothetical protein
MGGCNRGATETESAYRAGVPRFPDDEGVVTDVNFERLTIDGQRKYEISQDVESFSTYDGTILSLLVHKNRYAQLGLDGKTVVWISGIGLVLEDKTVVYVGEVSKADEKRLIFKDGTVLQLHPRVSTPPAAGQRIKALILPDKHQIVEVVAQ